jgi:hypothetical protein
MANTFFMNKIRHLYFKKFFNHVVLPNSFWGFEKPLMLPPNIVATGPLAEK